MAYSSDTPQKLRDVRPITRIYIARGFRAAHSKGRGVAVRAPRVATHERGAFVFGESVPPFGGWMGGWSRPFSLAPPPSRPCSPGMHTHTHTVRTPAANPAVQCRPQCCTRPATQGGHPRVPGGGTAHARGKEGAGRRVVADLLSVSRLLRGLVRSWGGR